MPVEEFETRGVSVVIWANHLLRSSIVAMQDTSKRIYNDRTVMNVEKRIAPLEEVFRLQNVQEYKASEFLYLPKARNTKAFILAATKGEGFGSLTKDRPKCLLSMDGKTILERQVAVMNDIGIKDISVVVGYRKKAVDLPNLKYIDNRDYAKGSILVSYLKVADQLQGSCVLTFGDILYEPHILRDLLEQDGDIVLAVDVSWWQGHKQNREIDAVIGEVPPEDGYLRERLVPIRKIGTGINHMEAHGEWIGLMKLSIHGSNIFRHELKQFYDESEGAFFKTDMNDFLMRLINRGVEIKGFYFQGHWLDIDGPDDLVFPLKARKASFT